MKRDIYIVTWECEDGKWDICGVFSDEMDAERELVACKALFDNTHKRYKCQILSEYLIGD
jgi:hypothetical protein